LRRILRTTPVLQIAAVVVLFIVTVVSISGFFNAHEHLLDADSCGLLGIAATGQTVAILNRCDRPLRAGADQRREPHLHSVERQSLALWSGDRVCDRVCGGRGRDNGFIIHRFRVPPLIVTLATGAMVTGATLGVTNDGEGQRSGSQLAFDLSVLRSARRSALGSRR